MSDHAPPQRRSAGHATRGSEQLGSGAPAILPGHASQDLRAQEIAVLERRLNETPRVQALAQLAKDLNAGPARPPGDPPRNRTGLPDALKIGVEQLSSINLDAVRVHYNSAEPAKLQAHAYAQGTEIHLAAGQERHLPHEAWHVAQQAQNRVPATRQLQGLALNDDRGLEREADVMGERAVTLGRKAKQRRAVAAAEPPAAAGSLSVSQRVLQRDVDVTLDGTNTTITRVVVDRNNEVGMFANDTDGAGDHTTSHVVMRHMIINQLRGQPVAGVPAIFDALYAEICALPGWQSADYVSGDMRARILAIRGIYAADRAAMAAPPTVAQIQDTAQALLDLRNSVPLSAFRDGRPGDGEGGPSGRLLAWEGTFRGAPATVLTAAQIEQTTLDIVHLLDTRRTSQELEGEVDHDETPGVSGFWDADRADFIEQHLRSIRLAYPTLWAHALAGIEANLRARIDDQIQLGGRKEMDWEEGDP
jgi:hypothetical protein